MKKQKASKARDGTNRGWPAGKARLDGGLTTGRLSVSLSEREVGALDRLMALWGIPKGEAVRKAILVAAGVVVAHRAVVAADAPAGSGADPRIQAAHAHGLTRVAVCPTCSSWDWETGSCAVRSTDPEVARWSKDARARQDEESPGMVVEHPEPCPGWR